MSQIERAAKDLIRASREFRDAVNIVYWAQNPEDFVDQDAPPVDEALETQHEAYLALESAEYYMKKALKK
jgi:hypothetical protein